MPPRILAALRRAALKIPDGKIGDIARRAGMSRRQLTRLRAGELLDMRVSTFVRLVRALGATTAEILGDTRRRGATLGRGTGRPRNIRREPTNGDVARADEDDDSALRKLGELLSD